MKNRKADYFFTAEYSETDFLSSIFKSNKKEVVIENEKGLVDRISLENNLQKYFNRWSTGQNRIKNRKRNCTSSYFNLQTWNL